jgi:hypothetical protein
MHIEEFQRLEPATLRGSRAIGWHVPLSAACAAGRLAPTCSALSTNQRAMRGLVSVDPSQRVIPPITVETRNRLRFAARALALRALVRRLFCASSSQNTAAR